MKCSICGIAVDSVDQAINNSRVPYFYEGDQEHEFAYKRLETDAQSATPP